MTRDIDSIFDANLNDYEKRECKTMLNDLRDLLEHEEKMAIDAMRIIKDYQNMLNRHLDRILELRNEIKSLPTKE